MIENRIIISDFSFWQDDDYTPYKINFTTSYKAGLDGTILRAGQNNWLDEDFLDYCRNADEAGLPRGAYWFFDSRVSPIPQADLFADVIEKAGAFPPLGIWGDYEENYGGVYGGEQNFKLFMDKLQTRFPGKLVGVYTGPSYWREHTSFLGRLYFKKFPLWIANYKVAQPDVPSPWATNEWLFWQFTAEGDGQKFGAESREVDLNYFNGDLAAYKERFNLPDYEPAPVPVIEPGENMYNVWSETYNMSLRDAASINGVKIVQVPVGTVMKADRIEAPSSGGYPTDKWAHIVDVTINGVRYTDGWVAIVHLGITYCNFEIIPEIDIHVLEVILDGELVYRKEF